MKTQSPLNPLPRMCRRSSGVIVVFVLLLGGVFPVLAQVPLGTWDCVITGGKRGTAQLTFNADGTIDGLRISFSSAALQKMKDDSNPRGGLPPGIDPRTGQSDSGSPTNSTGSATNTVTNSFGGAILVGQWGFYAGSATRLLGFLAEISSNTTNEVGFTGTVRGGSRPRLTLRASSASGSFVLSGIPHAALTDLTGDLIGLGSRSGLRYTEFLTFTSTGMNTYDIAGSGANYSLSGIAMLVGQRRLGLYLERLNATNGVDKITALTGAFNTNKLSGRLQGTDGARISYTVNP